MTFFSVIPRHLQLNKLTGFLIALMVEMGIVIQTHIFGNHQEIYLSINISNIKILLFSQMLRIKNQNLTSQKDLNVLINTTPQLIISVTQPGDQWCDLPRREADLLKSTQQNLYQLISLQLVEEMTPSVCSATVDYPTRSIRPWYKTLTIYKARMHLRSHIFQSHSRRLLQPAALNSVAL